MESIIHDHITNHCKENKILNEAQHGFRVKHSTITNLIEMLNDITKEIDKKNNIDLITIDFSKAFDTISHNKLIFKLQKYGVVGKTLIWIKEFLSNRSFKVCINMQHSVHFPVESSVPQGTKLGPLMFILFANDLVKLFKFAKVKMYADDISLYATINSNADRIKFQNELNELCQWASQWGLQINFDKCKVIHFGCHNNMFDYQLDNNIIMHSYCEKILGVLVDCNLSFSDHIFNCVKKASKMCNIILTNLQYCNNNVLVQLFKCYVRPILEYGSIIFSPHCIYLVDTIEHVQRNFTKRLRGLQNVSYIDRLQICNLESLELRRIHNDIIFVYKILNGHVIANVDLNTSHVVNLCTRGNCWKLYKYRFNLDVRKFFFTCRVINMWNSLTNDIVCSRNLKIFVNMLHNVDLTNFLKGHACKLAP
jgi:hypothetical protein